MAMTPEEIEEIRYEPHGFASITVGDKCGVRTRDGIWLIEPIHDNTHIILFDLIHVRDGEHNYLTDHNGTFMRDIPFDRIIRLYWFGRYYFVRRNRKYAVVDENLDLLTDYIYDECKLEVRKKLSVRIGMEWTDITIYDKNGSSVGIIPEWQECEESEGGAT